MREFHNSYMVREAIERSELVSCAKATSAGIIEVWYLKVGKTLVELGPDQNFAELFAEAVRPE